MRLGVIADDVTGATDLASVLRESGWEVIQTIGIPDRAVPPADAVVVSLKTRTVSAAVATDAASTAARWLRGAGAARIYFKYCSTFDSTNAGNIGPVIETLLDCLDAPFTIACPAYPGLGRSVYLGHLFVRARLLSESSMRTHPLTPMTDPDLVRVLDRQMRSPAGLVDLATVDQGVAATRARFDELAARGHRVAIADAVFDRHLDTLADACSHLALVTGAAGLGRGIARQAIVPPPQRSGAATAFDGPDAHAVILSGSCSTATQAQVQHLARSVPSRRIDPLAIAGDGRELSALVEWACDRAREGHVLLYSTAAPEDVAGVQRQLGSSDAATLVESAFRTVASALADTGVRTFVVAGGETAGAVLDALKVRVIGFGAEIEPGVPWTYAIDPPGFRLALKSGNFGSPSFFAKALGTAGAA